MNPSEIERFVLNEMKTRDWFYSTTVWGELKNRLGKQVSLGPIFTALHSLEHQGKFASWQSDTPKTYYRTLDPKLGPAILERHRRAEEIFIHHRGLSLDETCGPDQALRAEVQLLMDGETLDSHIAARTLTVDRITSIAIGIAFELRYAHHFGVRHGDVIAENVVVCPHGQIRLLHFGEAFSPDTRCDVIAIGVVLNEMLGGIFAPNRLRAIAHRAAHPDRDTRHRSAQAVQNDLSGLDPDVIPAVASVDKQEELPDEFFVFMLILAQLAVIYYCLR